MVIELLLDLAGEIIEYFIPDQATESKFIKHIERLKEEEWFATLEKDYRYSYIIYQNRKVKRFLCNEKNVKMILSMDVEKENFINLVKEEHKKLTGVR